MFNHPVISADGHIDLPWLPPGLFTENAPAALKSKMPKVVDSPDGKVWVAWQAFRNGKSKILTLRQTGDDFGSPMTTKTFLGLVCSTNSSKCSLSL